LGSKLFPKHINNQAEIATSRGTLQIIHPSCAKISLFCSAGNQKNTAGIKKSGRRMTNQAAGRHKLPQEFKIFMQDE
jgi:hypothetical protein